MWEFVSGDEIFGMPFKQEGTQVCTDGTVNAAKKLNVAGLSPGESGGHTHGGANLNPLPGPEDGAMAAATGETAYQFSPRGAFAIEKTAVGFRVRKLSGKAMTSGERAYLGSLILVSCVGVLTACAASLAAPGPETPCSAGQECSAEGRLFVFRGVPASVGRLETTTGCLSVALSEEDYVIFSRKPGVRVRVTGTAYENNVAEGVVSIAVRDREVGTGMCAAGLLIYADDVRRVGR